MILTASLALYNPQAPPPCPGPRHPCSCLPSRALLQLPLIQACWWADTAAWAGPHPQGCPRPQAEATQCPTPQGALTTPGATTTGSLRLTGHLGRFSNTRNKGST